MPTKKRAESRGRPGAARAPSKAARTARPPKPASAARPAKPRERMPLAAVMAALEKAGSAQARKTWARHGAEEPMFGVSFAELKDLARRIGVDHELAEALWATGNCDARNLAAKVADPSAMSPEDLDRWLGPVRFGLHVDSVAMLASESGHALLKANAWLAADDEKIGRAAWSLVGQLALRDETLPDAWFQRRLADIERLIHVAPNVQRDAMNQALISIGGRSPALRDAALATAKRIGTVHVDHGDTACKTPDAKAYVVKMWAHSESKGFESPAAQERGRERPRLRC